MKNMKILIVGSNGLLGEGLSHIMEKYEHDFVTTYFKKRSYNQELKLDVRHKNQVKNVLENNKPDVVINTSAISNPEICEENPDNAYHTNVEGTQNLAKICNVLGIYYMQVSTEYVFDGKSGPCSELDIPNPISTYGKTKYESEKITLEINSRFCVARTAMLFGWSKNKSNLATYVITKLRNKENIQVIDDQIVSPSYNNNVGEMLIEIGERKLAGIYHVCGSSVVSRYEFALKLANIFHLDNSLIEPISIDKIGWKTKRPLKIGLVTDKVSKILSKKPLTVEKSLDVMMKEENHYD